MSSGQMCLCVTSQHFEKGVIWSRKAKGSAVKKHSPYIHFNEPGKGLNFHWGWGAHASLTFQKPILVSVAFSDCMLCAQQETGRGAASELWTFLL